MANIFAAVVRILLTLAILAGGVVPATAYAQDNTLTPTAANDYDDVDGPEGDENGDGIEDDDDPLMGFRVGPITEAGIYTDTETGAVYVVEDAQFEEGLYAIDLANNTRVDGPNTCSKKREDCIRGQRLKFAIPVDAQSIDMKLTIAMTGDDGNTYHPYSQQGFFGDTWTDWVEQAKGATKVVGTFTITQGQEIDWVHALIWEMDQGSGSFMPIFERVAVNTVTPAIDIEKATNGQDADTPTGPQITEGDAVTWTYVVQNTGEEDLSNVAVSDDKIGAITCPQTTLAVGESMTCEVNGTAVVGQYANLGTVTGVGIVTGQTVTDEDPSHYFGVELPVPGIQLKKYINDDDSEQAPGPQLTVGTQATVKFIATNTGETPLHSVVIEDNVFGTIPCPKDTLAVGESMECTIQIEVVEGQHANTGVVTGTSDRDDSVTDNDKGHYFGNRPSLTGSTSSVAIVANDGNTAVTDLNGTVTLECTVPAGTNLQPGESAQLECHLIGGTATGNTVVGTVDTSFEWVAANEVFQISEATGDQSVPDQTGTLNDANGTPVCQSIHLPLINK